MITWSWGENILFSLSYSYNNDNNDDNNDYDNNIYNNNNSNNKKNKYGDINSKKLFEKLIINHKT